MERGETAELHCLGFHILHSDSDVVSREVAYAYKHVRIHAHTQTHTQTHTHPHTSHNQNLTYINTYIKLSLSLSHMHILKYRRTKLSPPSPSLSLTHILLAPLPNKSTHLPATPPAHWIPFSPHHGRLLTHTHTYTTCNTDARSSLSHTHTHTQPAIQTHAALSLKHTQVSHIHPLPTSHRYTPKNIVFQIFISFQERPGIRIQALRMQ